MRVLYCTGTKVIRTDIITFGMTPGTCPALTAQQLIDKRPPDTDNILLTDGCYVEIWRAEQPVTIEAETLVPALDQGA